MDGCVSEKQRVSERHVAEKKELEALKFANIFRSIARIFDFNEDAVSTMRILGPDDGQQ